MVTGIPFPEVELPGPGGGTDIPPTGTVGNWPSAAAIDNRISISERANNRTSPLHGMGNEFINLGNRYGINPGVVCAILQRESQLGCDGSILPTKCNNFSGITLGDGNQKCTAASGIAGRDWSAFPNAKAGLEGTFKLLNSQLYRGTGGRLEDVMAKYSPPFENDWNSMFATFAAVGSQLGITINKDTNIYTKGSGVPLSTGGAGIGGEMVNWALEGLEEGLFRLVLVGVGGVGLFLGVRGLINTHVR